MLAIAFRPLALLPWPLAAAIWETLLVAAFGLTIRRLGWRPPVWLAIAILAMPVAWSLTIGQAQVLVTALLVVGAPWAVALAAHMKLLPALVALYWLGRGDWESLARFAAWAVILTGIQLVLEPAATVAFLGFPNLAQVGEVNNLSIYAVSPYLWAALVVAGAVATIRLAPTRYGWAAAVALSVLATPRLLAYQLSTLLAGLRAPPDETPGDGPRQRRARRAPSTVCAIRGHLGRSRHHGLDRAGRPCLADAGDATAHGRLRPRAAARGRPSHGGRAVTV